MAERSKVDIQLIYTQCQINYMISFLLLFLWKKLFVITGFHNGEQIFKYWHPSMEQKAIQYFYIN